MLKHGKLSMGVLTSEAELATDRPRRRSRDMLRHPRWKVLLLTAVLFVVCIFLINTAATRTNVGWLFGWPRLLAENLFGEMGEPGTLRFALRFTGYYAANLLYLYVVAALLLRQRPKRAET
jgi:hypothetical protein